MPYPLISEYVESIKSAKDNFDELTNLRPVLNEDGTPVMSSGNFAVVFKMQDTQTGKFHAVRCFHREQAGRAESYRLIEAELSKVSSPYIVSFRYMERELFVDSSQTQETEFPVLLMDWVEGVTLDKYLREHIADQRALDMLTYHFSQLAVWLMPQPFAHGDLKPDNILVRPDGTPVLVDYDGMFVPAMQGQQARELGSPDFRHPLRTEDDFGERMDDFSLISILLSLKLTALHPECLAEYGASDRLLFSARDYADIANCQLLKAIYPLADTELNRLASLFMLCHSTKNLANVSFVLLGVEKPKELILSTEVTIEDRENAWKDEYGVEYSQDRKRLLHFPFYKGFKCYMILEGTEVICDNAFNIPDDWRYDNYGCYVNYPIKINIPDSVISIGRNAFGHRSKLELEGLTIPCSVVDIKGNPFVGCSGHIICKSPNYIYENGILYTSRKDKIVSCITNDNAIVIPDSVTTIGNDAFHGCYALEKIIIPNSVISIGSAAFESCRVLREITIPNSVTSIGDDAFYRCTALEKIAIPDSITFIGEGVFYECIALKKVIIPNSVTSIGGCTFYDCSALKEVTIPNSVTSIGECAFWHCRSLEEIVIPNSVLSVERGAFWDCSALKKITISNSVKTIENNTFSYCYALEKIVIPDSVTSIGWCAFSHCSALQEIAIPNSITTIGNGAFWGCSSLREIIIPDSVTSIGDWAFDDCSSLHRIIIPRNTRQKFEELLPKYKDKLVEQ